jgi:hypothetical protein
MSNYNFGDTFIKNNRAYIVVGKEGKRKDKFYYVQTRSGKLLTRSQVELDDLVERLEYKYEPGLCNPKFVCARDIKPGDMIVGRCFNKSGWGYSNKKRAGIVISKRTRRDFYWSGKHEQVIKIMWTDGGETRDYNFRSELFYYFNKKWNNNNFHREYWTHIPVLKTKKEKPVPQNDTQETSQPVSACSFPSVVL